MYSIEEIMYSISYCNGNSCVFLNNDVKIGSKIYKIEAGKYELSKKKVRMIYPSTIRYSVRKYVYNDDLERVVNVIVAIRRLMFSENLKCCPGIRFLTVRVCSALGCEPREWLRDIYPTNEKAKHEFLFYGIIVPTLSIDVSGCIYYKKWAKDVRLRCGRKYNICIGYEWKSWDDRWTEFWWKENNGLNNGFVKCG